MNPPLDCGVSRQIIRRLVSFRSDGVSVLNIDKQVALITGASSGIGKDFALRLLAKGCIVYAAARRVDQMADIEAAGGFALAMDVTDDSTMVSGVDRVVRQQGRIDILINNAGYGQYGALEDVAIEVARRQFEVNLFGLARLTQLCLPHMRAQKFGRILNISSIGGRFAAPLGGWYHSSKFALEGYSDALRNEARRFGIDVVIIEPGAVQSEWSGIAAQEAKRFSSDGVYAPMVSTMEKFRDGKLKEAPASVISDLVIKALTARTPKARYHGGTLAGPMLFFRRWCSDRMFDKLIMSAFK